MFAESEAICFLYTMFATSDLHWVFSFSIAADGLVLVNDGARIAVSNMQCYCLTLAHSVTDVSSRSSSCYACL